MTNEIKFLFNGIKIEGKLVKGYYSKGSYTNGAIGCFYVHNYFSGQSQLLRKYFEVKNDSDIMTDFLKMTVYIFIRATNILRSLKRW